MTTRTAAGVWLCPAPEGDGHCLAPLPCGRHEIRDVGEGMLLYGNAYGRVPHEPGPFEVEAGRVPSRSARGHAWRRLPRLALYAVTCVLIVSSLGDDRFTGKTLLTLAAVALSTRVLLVRLNGRR